jgi:uncharacterized protein involved in exopolysaccharide biosynthesis
MHPDAPSGQPLAPPPDGETSVLALVNSVLKHRRLVIALACVGGLGGGVFGLTRPHTYTSHASFTADDQRGVLAGTIANQLGLSAVLGNNGSPSAQLYLDLLQSPVILDPVVDSEYVTTENGRQKRTTLWQLYRGNAETRAEAHANAVAHLIKHMATDL